MKIIDAPLQQTMPAGAPAGAPAAPALPAADTMLSDVGRISHEALAPLAERIDREGFYPQSVLQSLGRAGAFRSHMAAPRGASDFGAAIGAMAQVSATCMSTGFLTWCQDVCALYIEQSGNAAMIERRLDAHLAGATLGGTGMSNPMKTFSGIETLLLRARRVAGGYLVNGTLPWVSNIGPGHYLGAVCQVFEDDTASHEVMFLLECDAPGVVLKRCPVFAGMEGTNTFSVRVTDLFIGDGDILADPIQPYLGRIKAAFILLQTGMALGVVRGAIDSIWAVEQQLGHVNQYLEDRPDQLQAEADDCLDRIMRLAATPYDGSKDYLLEVLDARAYGAQLSLRATQSALLHQGARGYLMSSAVQRRVREAHFVAIVTPAIKHLRKEMARLSPLPLPA